MFCGNCGNKLKDSSKFCDKCGAPVAGLEKNGISSPAEKQRNKKNLPLLLAALAVCILAATVVKYHIDTNSVPVKFEDFLVERCVREALDKSWDEEVFENEAASIKELTISWEKDMTVGLDMIKISGAYIGYVNLADLQYLTGLESLRLDFYHVGNEVLENMQAVTNCKKLEKLTMPLLLEGYNVSNGYLGKGYRYLSDIFSKLPLLEEVDFGVTIPASLQELLSSSAGREIVFKEGEDFKEYVIGTSLAGRYAVRLVEEDAYDSERRVIVPTELSSDVEDAVIYVGEGEIFDCQNLASCTELKTLVIWNNDRFGERVQIKNMGLLAKLPYLSSISFVGADINLGDLKGVSSLRELYLSACNIQNTSELQKLTSLRELYIVGGTGAEGVAGALPEAWKKLSDLCYFYGAYINADEAYRTIKDAKKLQTLVLLDPLSECLNALGDADESVLKTLFLMPYEDITVDLRNIGFNQSLENFFINRDESYFQEFIHTHPNLTTVVVGEWRDEENTEIDATVAYYNEVIDAAVQNENISRLDVISYYTPLPEACRWDKLYKRKIYNKKQLRAFMEEEPD